MNPNINFVGDLFEGADVIEDNWHRRDLPPGSAKWSVDQASLLFTCPCGCGRIHAVGVKPASPNGWDWDGNLGQPSLHPSIQITTGCRWHGYLTKGIWNRC